MPHLVTGQHPSEYKLELVRRLRREMTPEETLLWSRLRGNKLRGLHFRRQQPIHGFVADFYCHTTGVVVEVDGPVHDEQFEYDTARDLAFTTIGLLVLRFRNEDVVGRIHDVLERIEDACVGRIVGTHPPAPSLQGGGEGQ